MTKYPLLLADIMSWLQSKQRELTDSEVSLIQIRERPEHLPAASADFTAGNAAGRINGWISGEFDLEVVRVSDGSDVFWRHVKVSEIASLESTYAEFLREMLNANKAGDANHEPTAP